jgi:hypothetical protein
VGTQCDRVGAGNAQHVIQALGFLKPRRKSVQKKVDQLAEYLTNNLDRMDCPAYKARGPRDERRRRERNFHVTGSRLKLRGRRWEIERANSLPALQPDAGEYSSGYCGAKAYV